MDFKIRGYQTFQGEFLRTDVKISQKLIDLMSDEDLMQLRAICSSLESELFDILRYYAAIALEHERNPDKALVYDKNQQMPVSETSPKTNEETSPETNEETSPETNPETNPENPLSEPRVTAKATKKG